MNIVCKLLDCWPSCMDVSTIFTKYEMYKVSIETLSSILIKTSTTTNANFVLEILVKHLLECNNIPMGYFLIDIWNSWSRWTFYLIFLSSRNKFHDFRCLSDEQRYNLILFWSEINKKFSIIQPIHLLSVHVKILLQNLYDSLSGSSKATLRNNRPILSNIKMWTALGLQRISDGETEAMEVHMKIGELQRAFFTERTDSSLYKLVCSKYFDWIFLLPQYSSHTLLYTKCLATPY